MYNWCYWIAIFQLLEQAQSVEASNGSGQKVCASLVLLPSSGKFTCWIGF